MYLNFPAIFFEESEHDPAIEQGTEERGKRNEIKLQDKETP
jgi:hypothetical protein